MTLLQPRVIHCDEMLGCRQLEDSLVNSNDMPVPKDAVIKVLERWATSYYKTGFSHSSSLAKVAC
ncbi:MAG: hypothetical protein M0P29_14195, partial [Sphaerochaetaceae bacterium]|nr:hypothetical protein [Sphaerochaetaceae bacterium]